MASPRHAFAVDALSRLTGLPAARKQATAGPALLPPFLPSPTFGTAFQTAQLFGTADAPRSALVPPAAPLESFGELDYSQNQRTPRPVAAAPSPSTFFGRLRSNSLASNSHGPRRSGTPPPPLPSGPSTPSSLAASSATDYLNSASSSSTAPSSVMSIGDTLLIKTVSIPHHSGSGKHCLFACRVVPVASPVSSPLEGPARGHSRRESLGKMALAGHGEPHTVWRSWQDFVDFASSLATAFPDDRPMAPSASATFPTSLHTVPRLASSKKLASLFARSPVAHRQNELSDFCEHLFRMSSEVKDSLLVRDFFRMRPEDVLGVNSGAIGRTASSEGVDLASESADVPDWLSAGDPANDLGANDATIKAPRPRPARPILAIKTSSPDLRASSRDLRIAREQLGSPSPLSGLAASSATDGGLLRPLLASSASSFSHPVDRPDSKISLTTASSSRTVTPIPNSSGSTTPASVTSGGLGKTLRKKASGGLRHIRSLGDLRGAKKAAAPEEPVPALSPAVLAAAVSSVAMDRAATSPMPSRSRAPLTAPPLASTQSARRPSAPALGSPMGRLPQAPSSAPLQGRHRRTGSSASKSSISSFEDLWGTPFPTAFRQTPSGRVEGVRDLNMAPRRPSLSQSGIRTMSFGPSASTAQRTSLYRPGHMTSSASISSLDSARSGGSSGSARSMAMSQSRSSGGSEMCPTPPTPHMEWAASSQGSSHHQHDKPYERVVAGKYYIENGVLHENNTVPPPPFFPVPPPMQYAYSHDGLPHTPRTSASSSRVVSHGRKSSTEQPLGASTHSRTGSTVSSRRGRSSLGPILASPAPSSNASSPRTIGGGSASWTFKLLHADENVVLRVAKPVDGETPASLELERLRTEVQIKFKASGVTLPGASDGMGEWGLAWTTRTSGAAPTTTKLIVTQEDLNACLREHGELARPGKVVLKIIC
ncbi:uncharacterized protein JCM10292_001108 [Rhodotorula paludigena]|uniref:uncharacterized protein n=1 Tax=Rhodotorula paludigena TaxID=86838 RepID=UPI00317A58D3